MDREASSLACVGPPHRLQLRTGRDMRSGHASAPGTACDSRRATDSPEYSSRMRHVRKRPRLEHSIGGQPDLTRRPTASTPAPVFWQRARRGRPRRRAFGHVANLRGVHDLCIKRSLAHLLGVDLTSACKRIFPPRSQAPAWEPGCNTCSPPGRGVR